MSKSSITDLLPMFDTFRNTLDSIEIKGRENCERMLGCMGAVDRMEAITLEHIEQLNEQKGVEPTNGRQSNIGTDSGKQRKPG